MDILYFYFLSMAMLAEGAHIPDWPLLVSGEFACVKK